MSIDTKRPRGVRKAWASADMQESIAAAVELAKQQKADAQALRALFDAWWASDLRHHTYPVLDRDCAWYVWAASARSCAEAS